MALSLFGINAPASLSQSCELILLSEYLAELTIINADDKHKHANG